MQLQLQYFFLNLPQLQLQLQITFKNNYQLQLQLQLLFQKNTKLQLQLQLVFLIAITFFQLQLQIKKIYFEINMYVKFKV